MMAMKKDMLLTIFLTADIMMGENDWLSCRICRFQTSKSGVTSEEAAEGQTVWESSPVLPYAGIGHTNR